MIAMKSFQVDRLRCKRELVTMIIQGSTLREMVELVSEHGEQCSKSAVDRYLKAKLIEGCIYQDGSVEIKEKEGYQVRMTKYPPKKNEHAQPEIKLIRSTADC